jgi:hypothetical protein
VSQAAAVFNQTSTTSFMPQHANCLQLKVFTVGDRKLPKPFAYEPRIQGVTCHRQTLIVRQVEWIVNFYSDGRVAIESRV